jgi:1-acyl-sn-glycerol-3-phosphate acyltransferase
VPTDHGVWLDDRQCVASGRQPPKQTNAITRCAQLSSIKTAVDILQNGEIILIFPTGTRKAENAAAFKRGAATVALHARVPLVPAFYEGPENMQMGHMMHRPRIRVTFGAPIPTTVLPLGRATTFALTHQLEAAIAKLKPTVTSDHSLMDCRTTGSLIA